MTEPTEGAAVTATPARDTLAERYHSQPGFHALVHHLMKPGWRDDDGVWHDGPTVADIERVADLVDSEHVRDAYLAALVESGWRPTADQLRALGGEPATLTNVEWPLDLGTCPYNQRGKPGADPNGTCSFGCYDEPECQTCRPREGWPSDRGEMPEPWVYTAEPMALPHPEGHDVTVWAFPEGVDGD